MQSINLCKEVLENAIGVHETCEKSGMEMQPLDVVAVQAMKELLQYREIGEVSTCRNAVEICRAMIERGIEPDNIKEYIKFEDYVVQKGFTIKGLLKAGKKQIPYKPRKERLIMGVGRCKCGVEFLDKGTNFCGNCGQKLDWRGVK